MALTQVCRFDSWSYSIPLNSHAISFAQAVFFLHVADVSRHHRHQNWICFQFILRYVWCFTVIFWPDRFCELACRLIQPRAAIYIYICIYVSELPLQNIALQQHCERYEEYEHIPSLNIAASIFSHTYIIFLNIP